MQDCERNVCGVESSGRGEDLAVGRERKRDSRYTKEIESLELCGLEE